MEDQVQAAPSMLKFPCSACGAELTFAPGAASLQCRYCGHTEAIPQAGAPIMEYDFDSYMASLPTGWGATVKELGCHSCGAHFAIEQHVTSASCPFCGNSQVEPQEVVTGLLKPESLVPFRIEQDELRKRFAAWLKGLWFRPDALKSLAVSNAARGVYVPFWAYDTMTYSFWTAEAGYHYYVQEAYTENGQTRTRDVRHTRWEPVSGTHSKYFDDVTVPASKGVAPDLAQRLEYDLTALVPYQPQYLVGLTAEDYSIDMKECWPTAKGRIDGRIYSECLRLVPGDDQRGLNVQTSYMNRRFKLTLLPIWVATYRFGGKQYRYLCNGQSGVIQGEAPISWVKVTAFLAFLVAAIVALVYFFG